MIDYIPYCELIGCAKFRIVVSGEPLIYSYVHVINGQFVYVKNMNVHDGVCDLDVSTLSEIIKNKYAVSVRAAGDNIKINYIKE